MWGEEVECGVSSVKCVVWGLESRGCVSLSRWTRWKKLMKTHFTLKRTSNSLLFFHQSSIPSTELWNLGCLDLLYQLYPPSSWKICIYKTVPFLYGPESLSPNWRLSCQRSGVLCIPYMIQHPWTNAWAGMALQSLPPSHRLSPNDHCPTAHTWRIITHKWGWLVVLVTLKRHPPSGFGWGNENWSHQSGGRKRSI